MSRDTTLRETSILFGTKPASVHERQWLQKNCINQSFEILKSVKYILADIQLKSKHNQETRILICIIGVFNKYEWEVPRRNKSSMTIIKALMSF